MDAKSEGKVCAMMPGLRQRSVTGVAVSVSGVVNGVGTELRWLLSVKSERGILVCIVASVCAAGCRGVGAGGGCLDIGYIYYYIYNICAGRRVLEMS